MYIRTLLVLALAATAMCAPALRLSLSPAGDGRVECQITNTDATDAATFLQYHTPFEHHVMHRLFEVLDVMSEREVAYVGPLARRVFPPPSDAMITLEAGESISRTIDIAALYDLADGALYRVQFRVADYFHKFSTHELLLGKAVHVRGRSAARPARVAPATNYINCDASQKQAIPPSASGALRNSNNAFSCLAGGRCNSTTTRWFGTRPEYDYLTRVYDNLSTYISQDKFRYHCNADECQIGVYAYVYPTDPTSTINLCNTFFRVVDERVNTIVHETSHFAFNRPGTLDVEYGQPACLVLAKESSLKASHNADNVCYYAADA